MDQKSGEASCVPSCNRSIHFIRSSRGAQPIAFWRLSTMQLLIAFITTVNPSVTVRTRILRTDASDQPKGSTASSSSVTEFKASQEEAIRQ